MLRGFGWHRASISDFSHLMACSSAVNGLRGWIHYCLEGNLLCVCVCLCLSMSIHNFKCVYPQHQVWFAEQVIDLLSDLMMQWAMVAQRLSVFAGWIKLQTFWKTAWPPGLCIAPLTSAQHSHWPNKMLQSSGATKPTAPGKLVKHVKWWVLIFLQALDFTLEISTLFLVLGIVYL